MGKTIVINYNGCIVPDSPPFLVKANPSYARKFAEIVCMEKADVIFCSERGMESLEQSADDLEGYGVNVSYIIAEGGSLIKERKSGRLEMLVPKEQFAFIDRLRGFLKELSDGNNYVTQESKRTVLSLFRDDSVYSTEQFFDKFEDLMGDLMICGLIRDTDLEKIQILKTHEGVDIYPKSAGKGKALRRILNQAGLDDTFIGIGDGYSDLKWLSLIKEEFGGIIIVPGNAVDEIKAAADYIGNGENLAGVVNGLSACLAPERLCSFWRREISAFQV